MKLTIPQALDLSPCIVIRVLLSVILRGSFDRPIVNERSSTGLNRGIHSTGFILG